MRVTSDYTALDIGLDINAGGDAIEVTWEGYGAQADLSVIDASWATWTSTTTGVAEQAETVQGYLQIDSETALQTISDAIDQVAGYKAEWGAGQNRLEYTVSNLMNVVEFTSAARSRIQDADFAVEAARLAKAQVLQQTGTAMLAQANASPQLAISLIS